MHFKAENLRIPKHPRLLFPAQNLGVLGPSKTRYDFLCGIKTEYVIYDQLQKIYENMFDTKFLKNIREHV